MYLRLFFVIYKLKRHEVDNVIEYTTKTKEVSVETSASCDRCKTVFKNADETDENGYMTVNAQHDLFERQEMLNIKFRGGYGSIFGDCDLIECDLCQNCVKELLGEYIRITPGSLSD